MKHVTGKKRGRSVLLVKVSIVDEEGITTTKDCVTQQDIFEAAEPVLADRFSGAFSLPFYSGRIFGNMGFMDEFKCAQQVLEGTYIFPEGIDPATKMFQEEFSIMCLFISREEVSTFVTVEDYHYYLKK